MNIHDLDDGAVVSLLTGGPLMTVEGFCEDCGGVDVVWFVDTPDGWVGPLRDTFGIEALVEHAAGTVH